MPRNGMTIAISTQPTRLDEIKNFHVDIPVSAVRPSWERRFGDGRQASTAGLRRDGAVEPEAGDARRYPARNRRGPERADHAAHPGKPPRRARRLGCDHRRGDIDHWNRPRGRDGSRTARVGPRRLLPRVRRPPALRVQAVDALGACLLRGRAWKLLHQARVRSLGPCAGSAADGVVGRRLSACGPKRRARLRRRMGPPVKRHGIGGRHAHDAQAGPLVTSRQVV